MGCCPGPEGAKLDQDALHSFQLMTSKPFIFVFNMDAAGDGQRGS